MSRRTGRPSHLTKPPAQQQGRVSAQIAGAVVATVVVALVGGLIGYVVGRPDATERTIAQLREAEVERDVEQIIELTAMARRTAEQLSPILTAVREAADAGRTPEPAQVEQWQQTLGQLTAQFADPPSGTTATNVARGGLRSAVDQAAVAIDLVALAAAGDAAGATGQVALAARQVDLAVVTWSVAASQLDQINIDAGQGHQHVFLETGGEAEGALTPDGAAEGTGG
ncbi:hypothetical protein O7627_27020 [Solwaraspora sp. WMMD1047]|uniref:hypothetical protein n=1 Tax=Solwaraspora sp. WMMD1047 TaxID=3016102 RepID=UPI002417E76D|nr:hypothetical protein [Solwaraspora sp. WMMD1047]MDG4832931.1 hypothetical protein [Solwaraspora sp. WMMD1047]